MVTWNEENVFHLLNRAGFGASPKDVPRYVRRGQVKTVDALVSQRGSRAKGPSKSVADPKELEKLAVWWCKRMAKQNTRRLQEKMVLFWSDHFSTQYSVVKNVRAMSYQNRLFREFGMGNMKTLIHQVTRDAAMLEFLDGRKNKKNALNENYARELMELFVLGVMSFDGSEENYTEDDVQELTRATTGYQISTKIEGYFNPGRFDSTSKTLFATKAFEATGNLGVEDGNGTLLPAAQNIIDILFSHTDSSGNLTMPRFIGKKLWEWFGFPAPPASLIDDVTADFRSGNFVIADLLRSIFMHDEFYSNEAKTSSVKNPAEFALSAIRALDGKSTYKTMPAGLAEMGMELFNPPTVNGWPSGKGWLSTGQLLARFQVAQQIGGGRDKNIALLRPTKIIPRDATTEEEVVDEILARLGNSHSTPPETRQALIDYFEGQNDWDDEDVVERKVRGAIALALQLPESQTH